MNIGDGLVETLSGGSPPLLLLKTTTSDVGPETGTGGRVHRERTSLTSFT